MNKGNKNNFIINALNKILPFRPLEFHTQKGPYYQTIHHKKDLKNTNKIKRSKRAGITL